MMNELWFIEGICKHIQNVWKGYWSADQDLINHIGQYLDHLDEDDCVENYFSNFHIGEDGRSWGCVEANTYTPLLDDTGIVCETSHLIPPLEAFMAIRTYLNNKWDLLTEPE